MSKNYSGLFLYSTLPNVAYSNRSEMNRNRSTSNIVRAAEKVISSSNQGKEKRRPMKPERESGPAPRVVACADEKAEGEENTFDH